MFPFLSFLGNISPAHGLQHWLENKFGSFRTFYKKYQQFTIWKTVLVICRISQLRIYRQVRTRYLLTIFILNLKSNKFQTNSVLHQARSVNNLIYMVFILKLHRNALLVADPIPLLTPHLDKTHPIAIQPFTIPLLLNKPYNSKILLQMGCITECKILSKRKKT